MKTHSDPIVAEVRLAGLRLAEDAQGDLHAFFENLRHTQERSTVCAKKLAMRTTPSRMYADLRLERLE